MDYCVSCAEGFYIGSINQHKSAYVLKITSNSYYCNGVGTEKILEALTAQLTGFANYLAEMPDELKERLRQHLNEKITFNPSMSDDGNA